MGPTERVAAPAESRPAMEVKALAVSPKQYEAAAERVRSRMGLRAIRATGFRGVGTVADVIGVRAADDFFDNMRKNDEFFIEIAADRLGVPTDDLAQIGRHYSDDWS